MIAAFARSLRGRLSYATVVSSISAFIVLAGGVAYAANQIAKTSVGAKQLKAKSVTAAKLKKNSVTAAKIKKNAVTGAKVKDASLTGGSFAAGSRYSHVVHSTGSSASLQVDSSSVQVPLDAPVYSQAAGEDDFFYAEVEVAFAPSCEAERSATVYMLVDSSPTPVPALSDIYLAGSVEDQDGSIGSKRLALGPFEFNGVLFAPDAATQRNLLLYAAGDCKSGSGITVSNPKVLVTGVR